MYAFVMLIDTSIAQVSYSDGNKEIKLVQHANILYPLVSHDHTRAKNAIAMMVVMMID